MVIQNQEVDYAMDKARIDASGFDFLQSLKKICGVCGQEIKEDENSKNIEGLEVCEPCKEYELAEVLRLKPKRRINAKEKI